MTLCRFRQCDWFSRTLLPGSETRWLTGRLAPWQFKLNPTKRAKQASSEGRQVRRVLFGPGQRRFENRSSLGLH